MGPLGVGDCGNDFLGAGLHGEDGLQLVLPKLLIVGNGKGFAQLQNSILSELAINDATAFAALVETAKKAL